jgi:hypothetical protein
VQDLKERAQTNLERYSKQQKTRGTAFSVAGAVLGAATGGLAAGAVGGGMSAATGAGIGMQIGTGIGQVVSNTGQTSAGINNIISGAAGYYGAREKAEYLDSMLKIKQDLINMYKSAYAGSQYTSGPIDLRPLHTRTEQLAYSFGGMSNDTNN